MKRILVLLAVTFAVWFPVSTFAQSAPGKIRAPQGHVVIPQSSTPTFGVRMHTNVRIFVPDGAKLTPDELPPVGGFDYETPASLACIYGLVPLTPGCNPNSTTTNPSGGSGVIAIIDAYDDPNAASDLEAYSTQFGLAPANLTVVYASGSNPGLDPTGGWELEESIDLDMAHSMAPNAQLYLVEANSDSLMDLYAAVVVGANLVSCGQTTCPPQGGNGRGEVSMSWGIGEYNAETLDDSNFQQQGVVYLAAAGDEPGTNYPCVSPYVVCVGGTATARSVFTGNFMYEVAWMDAGGGFSYFEPRPFYQHFIRGIVGSVRGVPDLAFDASPSTGVWAYDTNLYEGVPGDWYIVFGTSIGTQAMAGILNVAGHFYNSSAAELERIYSHGFTPIGFTDIKRGYCGPYVGFAATPGWDFCTGVGSPYGYAGK